MNRRQIEIANAEAAVARWESYTAAAREARDEKRVSYGELRLANARKRLAAWLRP